MSLNDDDKFIELDKIPVRTEITVLPADEPKVQASFEEAVIIEPDNDEMGVPKKNIGFAVYEKVGIAIVNPRGLASAKKSVVIGEVLPNPEK